MMTLAMEARPPEPGPVPSAMGIIEATSIIVVMRIGRRAASRCQDAACARAQRVGVVDLEDAVFLHHAEEHEEAEDRVDVQRLVQHDHGARSAKGSDSGTASRIAIGWMKFSNCAARIMYMKIIARPKAMKKFSAVSCSVLARPVNTMSYPAGRFSLRGRLLHILHGLAERLVGKQVGHDGDFALALVAVDLVRSAVFVEVDEVRQLHQGCSPVAAGAAGPQGDVLQGLLRVAAAGIGAEPDIVEIIVLAVGADDLAADQRAQGAGDVLGTCRPNWLAFSRSMSTRSSGLRLDRVESTSTMPEAAEGF